MEHAHCMLDTYGYKLAPRICNSYCFSTTTVVTRTRLKVTVYVRYLSCYKPSVVTVGREIECRVHDGSKLFTLSIND